MKRDSRKQVTDEYLPAFVYGTLRSRYHNYDYLLKGNTCKEELATMRGNLHLVGGGSFPGLVHGDGLVVGELMYIKPDLFDHVLAELDGLERNGYMYQREKVVVTAYEGQVEAWTYYWLGLRVGRLLEHGDFVKYRREGVYK